MDKRESTPQREARRRYEEKNRNARKSENATFSTYIPRETLNEINDFLKENHLTKVALIFAGYEALQKMKEGK